MSRSVSLCTGASLPTVGLGTWLSKEGEVGAAVQMAVKAGYRHIDCASNYLNEHEIGDSLQKLFADNVVKREEIFITGKLNNPYHRKENVRPHLMKTLKDLQLDYLDLWLMHWPIAFKHVPFDMDKTGADAYHGNPDDAAGGANIDRGVSIRETWEAMEAVFEEGLVKAIGISNFNAALIHDLLSYAKVRPAVIQVESHPYLQQRALLAYCQREKIVYESYSPLGAGTFVNGSFEPVLLKDETLQKIGSKHGRSAAAVCLRWAVQRGTVPLPKSVNENRIQQNIDVYSFELDEDDMKQIAALDRNHHYLRPNDWYQIPLFTP